MMPMRVVLLMMDYDGVFVDDTHGRTRIIEKETKNVSFGTLSIAVLCTELHGHKSKPSRDWVNL